MVMDYYAFNGEQHHALKECIRRYFSSESGLSEKILPYTSEDSIDYSDVFRQAKALKKPGKNGEILYGKQTFIPPISEAIRTEEGIAKLIDYSVKDPFFTAVLFEFLKEKLESMPWQGDDNYYEFYRRFALPYTMCLFEMERQGCPVDLEHLKKVSVQIEKDIQETEKDFLRACVQAGAPTSFLETFNPNSPVQLANLLFDHFGFPSIKQTKKGGRQADAKVLEPLSHTEGPKGKAIGLILKLRALNKLNGTYIQSMLTCAPQYKGKIHSTYKQIGTATGRLSSAAPNLENIPAAKKDDTYHLRAAFVATSALESTKEKWVVADIDLSQAELRVTAHVTREEKFIALLNNGWDQHLIAMASLFSDVSEWLKGRDPTPDMVEEGEHHFGKAKWADWRKKAKGLNFGTIYGLGPKGYVDHHGGTIDEAKRVIDNYFRGFPYLKAGIKRVQRECLSNGHIRTYLGRYCEVPAIKSEVWGIRAQGERQAFNYKIQGTVADWVMMGMVLIYKDTQLKKLRVSMINQIHDELVFRMPESSYEEAKPLIESYVSTPWKYFNKKPLIVEMPAELGCGANWQDAKA